MKTILTTLLVGLLVIGCAANARSADEAAKGNADGKVLVATTFRASALTGMNVRNPQGEKLGTVNDLVVDIRTGKISYVALSVGGILGVGNKLFAVPFSEFKFDHGMKEHYFVLDISKQKLEAAPGFDQSNWPNFADPHWSERVDQYYREARAKEAPRATTK